MRVKLYQLYDRTAETVSGPIMAFNREAPAIREFHAVLAMGDKTQPGRYPDQFSLLEIGVQDTDTGEVEGRGEPHTVATGQEWLDQQERNKAIQQAAASNGIERNLPVGIR